jgi:protein O-GlcNAc transferase
MSPTFEIAVKHHRAGRLAEAEALYRQILSHDPGHADAAYMLGLILIQNAKLDEAVELFRQAIRGKPQNPEWHYRLGQALREKRQYHDAIESFRRAVQLNPNSAAIYNQLGTTLVLADRLAEAIECHRSVVHLRPDLVEAHNNLATTLARSGDLPAAVACYRDALRLNPNSAAVYSNLANVLKDMGAFDEAIAACGEAIRLDPNFAEAYSNLGIALKGSGRLDEAIAAFRRAVQLRPADVSSLNNLGNTLKTVGLIDEAISVLREAVRLKPDFVEAGDNLLMALNYQADAPPEQIAAEHRAWASRHFGVFELRQAHVRRPTNQRLKIGYVSPDFCRHSVFFFLRRLLEKHDRRNFQIYCYANVARPDNFTERARAVSDVWRSILEMDDDAAAALIRSDEIDVLVDLAGHTAGNRLGVFAQRPAPVQVSYLGYANTTGMAAIEFRLTDAYADPPGMTERLNVETLWRLPVCAWCYEPPDIAPEVQPRPDRPITFGCFNALAKINPPLLALWAQIMNQTEGSRLILKSAGLGETSVRRRLLDIFSSHGVALDRIELLNRVTDDRQHFELYHRVEIALDTYPYHGTTTTCEALWMGAAVVTLGGHTHASRVGISLMNSAGLPELIASTPQEYVAVAVSLAHDLPRLADLRGRLREKMSRSALMDATRLARDIETAFREMGT